MKADFTDFSDFFDFREKSHLDLTVRICLNWREWASLIIERWIHNLFDYICPMGKTCWTKKVPVAVFRNKHQRIKIIYMFKYQSLCFRGHLQRLFWRKSDIFLGSSEIFLKSSDIFFWKLMKSCVFEIYEKLKWW